MTGLRVAVLRAADAPAPTVVIDLGTVAAVDARRDDVRELIVPIRAEILARHSHIDKLGVKTIAVFPPNDDGVRVEFFQGLAHGELPSDSAKVCLNSLACALSVASGWYPELGVFATVTARMGGRVYHLSRSDSATSPDAVRRVAA